MSTHLLIDLISDHEVEGRLSTECDLIYTIVSNRGLEGEVDHIVATRFKALQEQRPDRPSEKVSFVHVAGHGNDRGVGLIGDSVSWVEFAEELKNYCSPLKPKRKRVLCLSCCHSEKAVKTLRRSLDAWFSGYYFFSKEKIGFAETIAAWSVFYLQKDAKRPMGKLPRKNSRGEEQSENTAKLINLAIPDIGFKHFKGLERSK